MSATVLLVDDQDTSLITFAALLEDAGFAVTTAESCEDARAKLDESGRFDLVVSDLHLEDGSGEELLREIRARDSGTRLALLSGEGPGDRDHGADAWLVKGEAPEALIASLRALLNGSGA